MKRMKGLFFSTVFLFGLMNLTAQEKQVPFFAEQDVVTIEKGYAKKMEFFQEYKNFEEARLFELSDGTYAVEIFYTEGGFLVKDRKVFTKTEKDLFLQSMLRTEEEVVSDHAVANVDSMSVAPAPSKVILNQKGRPSMLVMNTITGLGYYGWVIPTSLGVEDGKAFVGLYMLSAAAAFTLPYKITEYKDVSLGQASFTFYGQSRGGLHGFLLGSSFMERPNYEDYINWDNYSLSDEQRYDKAVDSYNRGLFGLSLVGSVAGGIAGYNLAERWEYNGGSTSIFQMCGDFGTISGLLLSEMLGFWERPKDNALTATTLGMSFVGMTVGKFMGDTRDFTLGDAIVYRSSIVASAMVPVTLVHFFEPKNESVYTTAGLLGIAAGSYLGWKATLNKDFSASEGVFVALGELAGGLLGAGLGYLVAPDNNDGQLILTTATLGALGGYGLMYGPFSKKAAAATEHVKLDIGFNPMGLALMDQAPRNPAMASMQSLVNLRLEF